MTVASQKSHGNKAFLTPKRRRDLFIVVIAVGFIWLVMMGTSKTVSVVENRSDNIRKERRGEFVLTFVGDTLIGNMAHNWEIEEWGSKRRMDDGFSGVKHLLKKSDFIVMNLEGPISDLPITVDPKHRKYSFSFGMDPDAAKTLKNLGVGALNLANNHVADRGNQGYKDTRKYLDQVDLPYFGTGFTSEKAAQPLFIDTPNKKRISITSFMGTPSFCCDSLDYKNDEKVHITLRPTTENAKLALNVLEKQGGADIKIAFVHWIQNYKAVVSDDTRDAAKQLADAGFDVIIGSAGSHTVKEFDWVADKPVFYDIGNFVFMKPGYWYRQDDAGRNPMTYGTVTHLIIDDDGPKELEIHCTQNDQDKVRYLPRSCTKEEADEMFTNLGPYLDFKKGSTMATVSLRDQSKRSDSTSGKTALDPVKKETWNVRDGDASENKESYAKLKAKAQAKAAASAEEEEERKKKQDDSHKKKKLPEKKKKKKKNKPQS
mmetsp:Transcript_20047/g.33274  ORF Transcript_20047/g.33274 Transcript_20047/m.33274 type:complete len:487 (+) Transcript_20047:105-1565(+)|eukprot:CAMPEP_0119008998 /NCGR_PEP_ID=MMETSP1176-20130426/4070_1 /TAXON_ID=265551 /ORGANISM="Synedropsis recta cf, Strain CCMP1620" /LENGTH=486 /DNA_ID=CAMNT_0006961423 /DNA_START=61 /DNA_END=1521 /DNA_ORIENTATION=-